MPYPMPFRKPFQLPWHVHLGIPVSPSGSGRKKRQERRPRRYFCFDHFSNSVESQHFAAKLPDCAPRVFPRCPPSCLPPSASLPLSMSAKRFSWFSMQASRCPGVFSPFVRFVENIHSAFLPPGAAGCCDTGNGTDGTMGVCGTGRRAFFQDGAAPTGGGQARENFFQSLENGRKIFPIIGKSGPIFPTIGKKFSNHWKTFPLPTGQRIVRPPAASNESGERIHPNWLERGGVFLLASIRRWTACTAHGKRQGPPLRQEGRSGAANCGEARFHGGRPFENTGISQ